MLFIDNKDSVLCILYSVKDRVLFVRGQGAVQCNTTLLSLCREMCLPVRHLQKTFNTFYSKT